MVDPREDLVRLAKTADLGGQALEQQLPDPDPDLAGVVGVVVLQGGVAFVHPPIEHLDRRRIALQPEPQLAAHQSEQLALLVRPGWPLLGQFPCGQVIDRRGAVPLGVQLHASLGEHAEELLGLHPAHRGQRVLRRPSSRPHARQIAEPGHHPRMELSTRELLTTRDGTRRIDGEG